MLVVLEQWKVYNKKTAFNFVYDLMSVCGGQ